LRPEMLPQFDKIVDLAIEDENVAGIGMHHRLAAIIAEIDDAEPVVTKCERFACFDMHAMIIRSAIAQALAHCRKQSRGVASAIAAEPAEYAAHAIAPEVPLSTICRAWASGIDQAMTPTPDGFQALRPVIEPVFYSLSDRSGFLEPIALHGLGQLLAPH